MASTTSLLMEFSSNDTRFSRNEHTNPLKNYHVKMDLEREDDEENSDIRDILHITIEDAYNETEYWIDLRKLEELGIAQRNVRDK